VSWTAVENLAATAQERKRCSPLTPASLRPSYIADGTLPRQSIEGEGLKTTHNSSATEKDAQMPDPPPYPDIGADTGAERPGGKSATGTAGWPKVSVIIVGVLVLLVVIKLLLGGADFGH
jgi:hypothetical protein